MAINNRQKDMEYKIPVSRQARLFKNGRDKWKERSNEKQKYIKYLEIRVRDLEKSREEWKTKNFESKAALDEVKRSWRCLKKLNQTNS